MFKTRLLSGIVLVILALITILSGGLVLYMTLLMLSLIGMQELYKAMGVRGEKFNILELSGYLGAVLYYLSLQTQSDKFQIMAIVVALILIMFVYVFAYPRYNAEQIMAAFFGILYVAVLLSYVYQTRQLESGKILVWLIFLSSWGCDTCAYCVGVLFGKHKMAPVLSPKKSIEGAVGGIVGAGLLGLLFAVVFRVRLDVCAITCLVGAPISMVGDLAASAIKRNRQIKDYGKLIPGHGGVLDRFDSVIFTAPIIYFLLYLFL